MPILFNEVLKFLEQLDKKQKDIQIRKEEINVSLFACDMIQKTLKTPPKKMLELIDEFNKVARYKINTQKLVVFLCTNNKLSGRELRKQFRIKYLGINLNK